MPYYRLYFLAGGSQHIERFEEYEAEDDHSAVSRAVEIGSEQPMELWNRGRKVSRFEATPVSELIR